MIESAPIGLIAVAQEIRPLAALLQLEATERWGDTFLQMGRIADQAVALANVTTGPVNAALGAQALIDRCRVRTLISFGSAGSLAPDLAPGDLIIAQRAVVHDAGIFLGARFEPTGVMGRDLRGRVGFRRHFEADPALVSQAMAAAQALRVAAQAGTVVTGNQVIFSTDRKRWLHHTFRACAVEMETAAVAQVAVAHGLPWVGVRAVSDTADDEMMLDLVRLQPYLDDDRAHWRRRLDRGLYLIAHPQARRRLIRLRGGVALASAQAARVIIALLERQSQNAP